VKDTCPYISGSHSEGTGFKLERLC